MMLKSSNFRCLLLAGSPFRCDVIDPTGITAMGDGLRRSPVGKSAMFIIDPHGLPCADFQMYCQCRLSKLKL